MTPGEIIFLNGTSSAGKSTLARAVQEIMERPFVHTGVDHYFYYVPSRLIVIGDGIDPPATDGWLVVQPEDTMVDLRLGAAARKILRGMYASVAALSRSGVDVIVDDVLFDLDVMRSAVRALADCPVLFVKVHCPLETAEARERGRPDRSKGAARTFHEIAHAHWEYDLAIDTSISSPEAGARAVQEASRNPARRRAFRRLYESLPPDDAA